jgi:hypothetical protein
MSYFLKLFQNRGTSGTSGTLFLTIFLVSR